MNEKTDKEYREKANESFNGMFHYIENNKKGFFSKLHELLVFSLFVPIIVFVFCVKIVDWILTKLHLKNPEPKMIHHFFPYL